METKEKVDVKDLIARADELIKTGVDFLVKGGRIVNFDGWLSISEYAKKVRCDHSERIFVDQPRADIGQGLD